MGVITDVLGEGLCHFLQIQNWKVLKLAVVIPVATELGILCRVGLSGSQSQTVT